MTADGKTAGLKFAEDILRWVELIASRLERSRSGPHFKQTWEDMGEVRFVVVYPSIFTCTKLISSLRKLIEEVCSWAREMLVSL